MGWWRLSEWPRVNLKQTLDRSDWRRAMNVSPAGLQRLLMADAWLLGR